MHPADYHRGLCRPDHSGMPGTCEGLFPDQPFGRKPVQIN